MTTITAQRINANDDQVGIVAWHVSDGDHVQVGDDLVDLETSKAVVTVPAEIAGTVRRIAQIGDVVGVGAAICEIHGAKRPTEDGGSGLATRAAPAAAPPVLEPAAPATVMDTPAPPTSASPVASERIQPTRFSKRALTLIAELDIDKTEFAGGGLVTGKTVTDRRHPMGAARPDHGIAQAMRDPKRAPPPLTEQARSEVSSLSKRAEIANLVAGESGTINSTLSVYFDSVSIRQRLKQGEIFDRNLQPILLYELSRLLRQWPQFTSYFQDNAVHFYDRIDIGLAIDLGRGLKVVTIAKADDLLPFEIHDRTVDFGVRYLENKIRPEELVDSTITVTDLSGFDILHFKPLINGHQAVILGIGGDSQQPGHPMSINMTFDHRVTNGREAALFLNDLRERLRSYALHEAGAPNAAMAEAVAPKMTSPARCTRCGIAAEAYYRDNHDALMFACVAADGSLQSLCLACTKYF